MGDLFRSPTVGDLIFFFFLQNECQPLDILISFLMVKICRFCNFLGFYFLKMQLILELLLKNFSFYTPSLPF